MRDPTRRYFLSRTILGSACATPLAMALQSGGPPKNVLVAGAGLAGLSAAYELLQAGHQVRMIEAQNRPGGRVLTLREPFSEGLYAEAGAESFGDTHTYVKRYVEQFDLPVMPALSFGKLRTLYYLRGQRLPETRAGFEWPVKLPASEQGMSWSNLAKKYIQPAVMDIGDPLAPGWPSAEIREKYDRISFAEMLRRHGATPEAISVLKIGYSDVWDNGTEPDSALCSLRDEAIARNARRYQRIEGGNDRLPNALAGKIGDRIQYGAALTRIDQNDERVTVTVEERGRQSKISADYLICAIPFSVLRSIPVEPSFSAGKQRTIRELSYQSVTRVFVQTKTRWWTAEGLSGYAATDLPIMTVWDCSAGEPGQHAILESYMSGVEARRMASLPRARRIDAALENLEKLFPGVRDNYETGASVAWGEAFAWFKTGQMSTLLPHIAGREGRVFFAGEHTSPWFGWMQGALQSGMRAAQEVNAA